MPTTVVHGGSATSSSKYMHDPSASPVGQIPTAIDRLTTATGGAVSASSDASKARPSTMSSPIAWKKPEETLLA